MIRPCEEDDGTSSNYNQKSRKDVIFTLKQSYVITVNIQRQKLTPHFNTQINNITKEKEMKEIDKKWQKRTPVQFHINFLPPSRDNSILI